MEKANQKKIVRKEKRTLRNRKNIFGSTEKPRMCVVKTNRHIQVQLIDDVNGHTLAAVSTQSKDLKGTPYCKKNKETAQVLGKNIAEKAKLLGIEQVTFDRGPFKFHGILEKLATSCREAGLKF